MKPRRVEVHDRMQQGYAYLLTEPAGRNFHPDFRPDLSPKQLLELGIFGGKYMTDCTAEFPADWFENARLCPERHDPELNYFGVNASQPLWYWREKGWSNGPPRFRPRWVRERRGMPRLLYGSSDRTTERDRRR